jgi:hypothetical protein
MQARSAGIRENPPVRRAPDYGRWPSSRLRAEARFAAEGRSYKVVISTM